MRTASLSVILAFCVVVAANAGLPSTLVEFDIANANAALSDTVEVASVGPNLFASPMASHGALGNPLNFAQSFCYTDWPTSGLLDSTKYYEFSIDPDPGFEIQYTDIGLAAASAGSGSGTVEIRGSLDSFSGSNIPLDTRSFAIDATWHALNLDISALGTQAGTVTFRVYLYNIPAVGFAGLGVSPTFGNEGQNVFVNGVLLGGPPN